MLLRQILYFITISYIVCDLYFSYFSIGWFPLKNYFIASGFAFLAIWSLIIRKITNNDSMRFVLVYMIIFFVLLVISSGWGFLLDIKGSLTTIIKRLLMPWMLFAVVYIALKNNRNYIYRALRLFVCLVALSSFVACMQGLGVDWFWHLRDAMPTSYGDKMAITLMQRARPFGLAYYFIPLGFQISVAFPLAVWLRSISRKKFFWNVVIIVLGLGVIAIQTRSAALSVGVCLMYYSFKARKNYTRFILKFCIVLFLIATFYFSHVSNNRMVSMDTSAYGKIALAYVAAHYILTHPLGIGFEWSRYFDYNDQNLYGLVYAWRGYSEAVIYTPHNQFFNTSIIYGWLGAFLLVTFYVEVFKNLKKVKNSGIDEGLCIALQLSLMSYIINSLFHNNGPMLGDTLSWFLFGIIFAVIQIDKNWILKLHHEPYEVHLTG